MPVGSGPNLGRLKASSRLALQPRVPFDFEGLRDLLIFRRLNSCGERNRTDAGATHSRLGGQCTPEAGSWSRVLSIGMHMVMIGLKVSTPNDNTLCIPHLKFSQAREISDPLRTASRSVASAPSTTPSICSPVSETPYPSLPSMHTAIIGASKGCGYHAALDILRDPSNTVTLLLRHPEGISSDPKFTSFIQEGRVKLVQGDATVEDDVSELFNCDKVDLLISTIGGQPHFGITTGYYIDSPVCTHFGLVLCNILASRPDVRPRVVITSTMGILGSYDCMPLFHRVSRYSTALILGADPLPDVL